MTPPAPPPPVRFDDTLARARRRLRRVALGEVAAVVVVAVVAALAVSVVVIGLVPFSDGLRALLLGAVGTLSIVGGALAWRARLSPLARDREVALALEEAARRRGAHVRGEVVGAVEMLEDQDPAASKALVDAHVASTTRALVASGADAALLQVALGAARGTFASLAIALVVAALGTVMFGDVVRDRLRRLFDGEAARLAVLDAEQNRPPLVTDLALTLRFPAYMARVDERLVGVSGDITAPRGTEVVLEGRADHPATSAAVVYGGREIALEVKDERQLSGRFVVDEASTYRFRLTGPDGRTELGPLARRITLEPDRVPDVTLAKPVEDAVVQVDETVPLAFSAKDDYGVRAFRLVVVRQGSGQPAAEKELLVAEAAPRELSGKGSFRPEELGGRPGDRLSVYVEALDNDTVSGPKAGRSPTRVLTVFSATEHHRELIEKEEALKDAMVDLLAHALEAPIPKDVRSSEDKARVVDSQARVASESAEVRLKLDVLLTELAKDALSPVEVRRALANMRTDLDRVVRNLLDLTKGAKNAIAASRPVQAYVFHHLRTYRGELVAGLERDILYLDDLLGAQRLEEAKSLTDEMRRTQAALKELLEKYKASPDDETRAAILEEIRRLKEQMEAIQKRLGEIERDVPEEHLNAEAFMSDEMLAEAADLDQLVEEGRIDEALKALEAMTEGTERLTSEIEESQSELGTDEYREIREKMREVSDELSALSAAQDELLRRSERMLDAARKEAMKKLEDELKPVLAGLLEKTRRANDGLKKIDPRGLFVPEQEETAFAQARVEDLLRALEAKDLDDALEAAREAAAATESAEQQVAERTRGRFATANEKARDAHDRLDEARPLLDEVREKLEEILPDPSELLDGAQRAQMRRDAKSQAELKERAEKLAEKLKAIGEELPLMGPAQDAQLGQAGASMREAAQRLQSDDLRGGKRAQDRALQALQELGEQMEQMGQGGMGGIPMPFPQGGREGGQEDGNGRRSADEEVEIPGAEDWQAPEQYRREILEAMREDAPPAWVEEVKRYYEELIK